MKQWLIYKHTSTKSGKSYIGMTCVGVKRRWVQHTSEARGGSNKHFHRAIKLYGEEEWEHTVLVDNISALEEAQALERFYIEEQDTLRNGYNLTEGGECRTTEGPVKYKSVYKWVHTDYGLEECTAWDLAKKYNLHLTQLTKIVQDDKAAKVCQGWQLYVEGSEVVAEYSETPITIYHKDGREDYVTPSEMVTRYNIPRPQILKLFRGHSKKVHGWSTVKHIVNYKSYKQVYEYDTDYTLLNTYESSFDCARCLGVKEKRVSGWLAPNKNRTEYVYENRVYSYVLIEKEITCQ